MKKSIQLFVSITVILVGLGLFIAFNLRDTEVSTIDSSDVSSTNTDLETFSLGFIPAERAEEFAPKAEALAIFLEERMGMPVEVVIPSSYEALIEGLRFGHLDASYMDAGPAWLAHKRTGAEVVLAELKNGDSFYYGEMFVRADSDISTLEDVLGKRIAFTSWTGSSGFVFPIGSMIGRGLITPAGNDFLSLQKALDEAFSFHTVSGGYTQSLSMLLDGTVDVVGGAHDAPERFLEQNDRDKIKTLVRLGTVPSHPVVMAQDTSEELRQNFVSAMMELNSDEYVYLVKELYGVEGLVETTTNEHLADFGPAFEAVTGIHEQAFAKKE